MTSKELKDSLKTLSQSELIALLSIAYNKCPEVKAKIDFQFGGQNYVDQQEEELYEMLNKAPYYPATELKNAVSKYFKVQKDSRKRLDVYFTFCEKAEMFYRKSASNSKLFMAASSQYKKAMEILQKEPALWPEYKERAYNIANKMYGHGNETGWQVGSYYSETRRAIEDK